MNKQLNHQWSLLHAVVIQYKPAFEGNAVWIACFNLKVSQSPYLSFLRHFLINFVRFHWIVLGLSAAPYMGPNPLFRRPRLYPSQGSRWWGSACSSHTHTHTHTHVSISFPMHIPYWSAYWLFVATCSSMTGQYRSPKLDLAELWHGW